jgi:hypothetical protein
MTARVEIGVGLIMHCIDDCSVDALKPTPGFVRVTGETSSPPVVDAMSVTWCDSTPLKPVGRPVKIPAGSAPPFGFGGLVGSVSQAETGDALGYSRISLIASPHGSGVSKQEKNTDDYGGLAIDSIVPGEYLLRARHVGFVAASQRVRISANQIEIVRVSMKTYRCHGY